MAANNTNLTARNLVESALREIGVLAHSETATAQDAEEGLTRLNRFIDTLGTERQGIYTVTRTTFTISANDGSYTIGATGDVSSIARPIHILDVKFQDTSTDPDTEYPLTKLTEDAYAGIALKAQTSTFPQAWYYNPTWPNATLILWPVPTATTLQGVIYHWTAVTQLAALTTSVSLPPGYEEMLVTNLAILLCPSYGRQPHPILAKSARDTLAAVKRTNFRPMDMSFDPAVLGGNRPAYSIQEG